MKLDNETVLPLREIARAWAQDSGTHTEAVIFEHLVHAFLSDEFAPLATDLDSCLQSATRSSDLG
jgi:hypothetical protein